MLERKMPLTDQHPGTQLLSLTLIIIVTLFFSLIFGLVFAIPFWGTSVITDMGQLMNLSDPSAINYMKYLQIVNQLGLFVFAPLFFAFLVERNVFNYLSLNIKPAFKATVISLVSIYAILPFVSWVGELNQGLQLPSFLSGVEDWMKSSEDAATQTMLAFLNVKSIWAMVFNVIMIALIPGIGEELLFRGVILKIFRRWTNNVHLAVIISAILFSALHMQFYGFLPRMVLGLLLGYVFVYTGSLWVPILIHFINNASAIIFVYASGSSEILTSDIESFGSTNSVAVAMISLLIVTAIILYLRKDYNEAKVISNL